MKSAKTNSTTTKVEAAREARKHITAECFTPVELANTMCDKLAQYSTDAFKDINKTFLDPSCGNGNLLIPVLQRKLKAHNNPIQALSTIYGCDIIHQNINETRLRLLKVIVNYTGHFLSPQDYIELIKTLARNIVCTPLSKYPNGSLDYLSLPENLTFNRNMSTEQAQKALDNILEANLLDKVAI